MKKDAPDPKTEQEQTPGPMPNADDIAKSVRPQVQAIAAKYGANVKVAEVPPAKPIKSPSDPNTLQSWPITRLFFHRN